MTSGVSAVHILVKGRVQGVGFRFFAQERAEANSLKGWVRNKPDGDVECEAEGARGDLDNFLEDLRKGPPVSRVDDLQSTWHPPRGQFTDFSIR